MCYECFPANASALLYVQVAGNAYKIQDLPRFSVHQGLYVNAICMHIDNIFHSVLP